MKFKLRHFVFLLSSIFVFSCSSSNESDKPENEQGATIEVQQQMKAWDELSPLGQKILGTYKGIIRDKYWGQSFDSIKEPHEKSENQPENGISFTQYLDDTDLNFVDISYLGTNRKLTDIKFDIFLENASDVKDLNNEIKGFLDVKYGKSKSMGKQTLWSKEKTRIVLEDVSTSKDPGLQLLFTQQP